MGGSSRAIAKTSVMKPGLSIRAPPKTIAAPSKTSFAGGLPAAIASLKRRHAARPCDRASAAPRKPSRSSSARVGTIPIAWPTWMIT